MVIESGKEDSHKEPLLVHGGFVQSAATHDSEGKTQLQSLPRYKVEVIVTFLCSIGLL